MEAARVSIGMAFDLLDENSDGRLSRLEVLKGLKTKPRVRELLQMGAFTDPAEFDAVYKAIDADGSNNVDRREFESYFMRRLAGGAGARIHAAHHVRGDGHHGRLPEDPAAAQAADDGARECS